MTHSYTLTETRSFTVTHARYLASKVATDLKRMQRFYSRPSDSLIADFEQELVQFLKAGYLNSVTYGFQRNSSWIRPTLQYTARDLASSFGDDDDPGRVPIGCDIRGASFGSFLTYSNTWYYLTEDEKQRFEAGLPFQRTAGEEPGVSGWFFRDKTYSSGGRAIDRHALRSW